MTTELEWRTSRNGEDWSSCLGLIATHIGWSNPSRSRAYNSIKPVPKSSMMLSLLDLLRQSVRLFDQSESLKIVDAATKLSTMGDRHIPKDLVTLGIKMHVRGFLNTVAVQGNLDWVWPYWIERQFNPLDKSYIPRGHGLPQINLTHRNWTIIGATRKFPSCDHRSPVLGHSLEGRMVS